MKTYPLYIARNGLHSLGLLLLFTVSFLGFFVPVVSAVDRFVSPTGNDSAAGTVLAPWKTIQKAASTAKAGDVVYVRKGTYAERVQVNVSGTAAAPIAFCGFAKERPVLDLSSLTPGESLTAAFRITNKNFITIKGFEICNYRTSSDNAVPAGILVSGACKGLRIEGNLIHHIEQNNTELYNYSANAHGIVVYGNAVGPIDGLVICGNELHSMKLGASEAMVVNGNVSNFQICNNQVHHVNNIAIDAIGYEGINADPELNRARNGLISGNRVWAVDSSFNPAYGGNFSTGGGVRAAAGIYVDGGTKIIIERNEVWDCDFGVELASEHQDGKTDYVTVRTNILRHNHGAGIIMGGYDENRGYTEHCTVVNNTLYRNDTTDSWAGQIQFQFYVRDNVFMNNIMWANPSTRQMVVHYPGGENATSAQKEFGTGNVFAYNLYFSTEGATASNVGFEMFTGGKMVRFDGVAAFQRSGKVGGDAASTFSNPRFMGGTPTIVSTTSHFQLSRLSPAINSGAPSAQLATSGGQRDFFGGARLKIARLDRGADEF
jgi:hypothetical protein